MERYEGPVPPGHGENQEPDARVPVCPRCGGMMRRGPALLSAGLTAPALFCDVHGFELPRWETRETETAA